MHWLSPFFYMVAKFGPLENRIKERLILNRDEISQKNSRYALFDNKRNEEILEDFKIEPSD